MNLAVNVRSDVPTSEVVEFYNDLTVQLLLYAHLRNKSVQPISIGTYYVRNDEYTHAKEVAQVGRIKGIIQWAERFKPVA